MNENLRLFFLLAAMLLALACTREGPQDGSGGSGPVEARITAGVATRADGSLWTADKIGVMVTEAPNSDMATRYVNVAYATSTSGSATADFEAVKSAERICFLDPDETVTFAAYAPYSETDDIATLPGTDGVISASTASQSTTTEQTALDFLYASGATGTRSNPEVAMNFSHVMSKVVIRLSGEYDGMSDAVISGTYYLAGLIHIGEFDVNPASSAVGTAYASGTTVDDEWELNSNGLKDSAASDCDISYSAIVFPQSPLYLDLIADIGGLTYAGLDLLSVVEGGVLQAGKSYTFNVTITTTELYVSGCTVSGWTSEAVSKNVTAYDEKDALILHYSITASRKSVTLPLYDEVDCMVDWGDGTVETVTSEQPAHTYSAAGEYDVTVKGTVTQLCSSSWNYTLTSVKQ